MFADAQFVLVSDQPVGQRAQVDLLNRGVTAAQLAGLIHKSRSAAPFTLAIYGDWGMGKSSLLQQLAGEFSNVADVETVWFNAWTATSANALEILIKSVLDRLDPRALRRLARRINRDTGISAWTRVILRGLAGSVHLHHLVDGIWQQLSIDARTRNDARELLRTALNAWTSGDGQTQRERTIVVFIDDLDRCSPEVIMTVCSAIKQYLSIPGLVFVLGCDQNVIEAATQPGHSSQAAAGRRYLEKIIQASYSIPVPTDAEVSALLAGYAHASGTNLLFQGTVADAVAQHAGRNPRRIKRLINRFAVEYELDEEWRHLGADALVRVILLQDFYPEFFALLARIHDPDPIDEITDYLTLRQVVHAGREPAIAEREPVERCLRDHGIAARERGELTHDVLTQVERELPEAFPEFARDRTFVQLVTELAAKSAGDQLRLKLRRRPAAAPATPPDAYTDHEQQARTDRTRQPGARSAPHDLLDLSILWFSSRPHNDTALKRDLRGRGARLTPAETVQEAITLLTTDPPDLIVSNVGRDHERDGGFTDMEMIRNNGYTGPVLFYTGHISRARRERAQELGAEITTSPHEVLVWITSHTTPSATNHEPH